jgi:hypothetical protein
MIDNMIFLSCYTVYTHKQMFEDRVPRETIVAFRSCAFNNAREQKESFYYLWKQYLAKSGGSTEGAAVEQERLDMIQGMMGDDDDDDDGVAAGLPRGRQQRRKPRPLRLAKTKPEGRVDLE